MHQLIEKIATEISANGAVSFARFMDLALYCPVYGYYEKEADTIGRGGDYYTSVSVGSLFGELLACQFADWLQECPKSSGGCPEAAAQSPWRGTERRGVELVEAGAHRGDLARDILGWLRRQRPELFHRLTYWIIEPSEARQRWQQRTLAEFGSQVRWARNFGELTGAFPGSSGAEPWSNPLSPPLSKAGAKISPSDESGDQGPELRGLGRALNAGERPGSCSRPLTTGTGSGQRAVRGVIFSNELLDAFPVHRLGWDARNRTWFEWGVTLEGDRFVWTKLPGPAQILAPEAGIQGQPCAGTSGFPGLAQQIATLADALPPDFTLEICPAATDWWREAAGALEFGRLLTIDYGLTAEEILAPARNAGTLRAYRDHRPVEDLLAWPGTQDLTAHVDFSALQATGEVAGLQTEELQTQAHFLTGIAARIWQRQTLFGEWQQKQARQFQTLTHPDHLGRAFRVLVQHRL